MKKNMTRATATAIKMLESLPEEAQEDVVEKMREVVEAIRDENRWQQLFADYKTNLQKVVKQVKKQVASGNAKPMDFDKL